MLCFISRDGSAAAYRSTVRPYSLSLSLSLPLCLASLTTPQHFASFQASVQIAAKSQTAAPNWSARYAHSNPPIKAIFRFRASYSTGCPVANSPHCRQQPVLPFSCSWSCSCSHLSLAHRASTSLLIRRDSCTLHRPPANSHQLNIAAVPWPSLSVDTQNGRPAAANCEIEGVIGRTLAAHIETDHAQHHTQPA